MEEEQQNKVRIAVVEEQIRGLREQHKAQSEAITRRLDKLDETMAGLVGVMNRGKGAYAASLAMAGIIGGAIVKLLSFILGMKGPA